MERLGREVQLQKTEEKKEKEKVKVKTDSLGGERTRKLLHHEGQESPSAALLNTLA